MAAILPTKFCKQILFFIQMSLYLIPKGLIDKKPALVQIMNRRQAIIWTEMVLFVDAYQRHLGSMT